MKWNGQGFVCLPIQLWVFCLENHEVKQGLILILVAFKRSVWEDHILVDNTLE